MWQIAYEDELYHHGIKGQKWGIRRYQNEDGSLTPEGERRYGHMYDYKGHSEQTKYVMKDWHNMDDRSFKKKYNLNKKSVSNSIKKYGDLEKDSVGWQYQQAINDKGNNDDYYNIGYKKKIGKDESQAHKTARKQRAKGIKQAVNGTGIAFAGAGLTKIGTHILFGGAANSNAVAATGMALTGVGALTAISGSVVAGMGAGNTIVGAMNMGRESRREATKKR